LVSCLDYLTNVENILSDATIIEEGKSEYIITSNLVDELTSLFIRGVFDVIIMKEFDYSKRLGIPLSLLLIDIDDFKKVNDQYGHQKGDEVLSKIGAVIHKSVRSMDIACRYGGEEFAVIMPNTESKSATLIAERIRNNIELHDFDIFFVTVSIGISSLYDDISSLTDFIFKADEALYKAKALGKNKVVISPDQ
jgi:diguanylate cyclase (GGDEF)-like protein